MGEATKPFQGSPATSPLGGSYAGASASARAPLPRSSDLEAVFSAARDMNCVSVVGVSNLGKSALLRAMTDPQVQERYLGADKANYLFIHVDFNQMLEMSEQAFCELILRCALDALHGYASDGDMVRRVETCYTGLVAPASSFEIPLRFVQAMAVIGDLLPERAVFLFDEIDGPVAGIDGRVFLNLRALKDRHWQGLTYVTATNRRLGQVRQDPDVSEFGELFEHHVLYISLLTEEETTAYVARFVAEQGVTFSQDDLAFVRTWAGGHPGLLEPTCRVLGLLTGRPVRDASQDWIIHRQAAEILKQDLNVQAECRKIWNDLTPGEQEALFSLCRSDGKEVPGEMDSVMAKHLVVGEGPERRIFARAFDEFIQRQHAARHPAGVYAKRGQAGPGDAILQLTVKRGVAGVLSCQLSVGPLSCGICPRMLT